MKDEIGKRVAALRVAAGKKQGPIAELLGVDVRTYRTREHGDYAFPIPELVKLAKIFGVSLDYLLTGEEKHEGLSAEEELLILWWRSLSEGEKKAFTEIVKAKMWEASAGD